MKKKHIHKKDIALEKNLTFCSECGEALDEFAISPISNDPLLIKENFHTCKKTGKFKGDVCSKIFISHEEEISLFNDEDL